MTYFKQLMYSAILHTSIQSNNNITGTIKTPLRLFFTSSMFSQKILTYKNLICLSNLQTHVIAGRPYKKGQWSYLIYFTNVLCMISHAELHLILSIMTSMSTKMKRNNQTIMRLCYHLMKKNNKATRVKMRMIKNKNIKNELF